MSAYLLVSLQAETFKAQAQSSADSTPEEPVPLSPFAAHRHWEAGKT